jgi:hypothetical protein
VDHSINGGLNPVEDEFVRLDHVGRGPDIAPGPLLNVPLDAVITAYELVDRIGNLDFPRVGNTL